ncbi:MAG: hypothetical protein OEY51_04735, partial [Cyclobacteriaceae bacterium]|nr:hypothetical protein [Cyclobacteriaceae bacterium]
MYLPVYSKVSVGPLMVWLCGLTLFLLSACENSSTISDGSRDRILPPFAGIKIPKNSKTIDPTVSQLVRFDNGMRVEVPKDAFTDAQGAVVTTPITLEVETYSSAAEILASGIPMHYDDGETSGVFESAGMFKISGHTGGGEVFI